MLKVTFDKKSRREMQVGQGECSFCKLATKVAKANPDMWICAKCFADTEIPGAIGEAERAGLIGEILVRGCVEDL